MSCYPHYTLIMIIPQSFTTRNSTPKSENLYSLKTHHKSYDYSYNGSSYGEKQHADHKVSSSSLDNPVTLSMISLLTP